jgi:4-hydroxy-3-methylbut-2-enyl diphosphate reductase
MTEIMLCAPSWLEAAALRRGIRGGRVVQVGIGRKAAAWARSTPAVHDADALAVAGVGGALRPDLAAGDVVVATEVRGAGGTIDCPSAPMLAATLRRQGLRVFTGPILSVDHVVVSPERETLAASGALCVEMESAAVLAAAPAAARAVVRVIADTAGGALLRPATAGRMTVALRMLPRVGAALEIWGRAAGPRQVLLAGPRSFCAGVVRAIDAVELALEQRGAPIYVRKQIVHNTHVVQDLADRGAVFVNELDEVPVGATVIFSAHGVSPAVRAEAERRQLDIIDATCPLVRKVHTEVRRFADAGDTVIFLGHAGHEEAEGTMGERPANTLLVETPNDARTVAVADPDRVSYLMQTTLAADEVAELVDILQARFPTLRQPPSDDICYATTNRQEALAEVARGADLALVVGSTNSSNSQRLVEKAERVGTAAHLIDDLADIDLEWLAGVGVVALTAGASAPTALVDGVIAGLRGLGTVDVQEHGITEEHVQFTLPKEVRQP